MMRIALFVLFVLMSASVFAREIKLSSPDGGGGCANAAASDVDAPRAGKASAVPPKPASAKPVIHSDAPAPRMQSPRWHSYLPGMFR